MHSEGSVGSCKAVIFFVPVSSNCPQTEYACVEPLLLQVKRRTISFLAHLGTLNKEEKEEKKQYLTVTVLWPELCGERVDLSLFLTVLFIPL